jgi:hypothetical protein
MTSLQQTAMGGGSPVTKTASYVLTAADAGTVIQMNSASSTTITVNTALFAAGDSVQIQNIGAGTTTITAGTATVNSAGSLGVTQYDGGFLYFSSTSSAIWFDYTQAGTALPLTTKGDLFGYDTGNARIPVGTNNQVLTADSAQALGVKWATPSAARNYTLLNAGGTAMQNGTTTITISGIGGYDNYYIVTDPVTPSNTNMDITMRLNGDSTGKYNRPAWGSISSQLYSDNSFGNTSWRIGQTQNSSGSTCFANITIQGASTSGIKQIQTLSSNSTLSGSQVSLIGLGDYAGTSAITSISFISSTSQFGGGRVYVYAA